MMESSDKGLLLLKSTSHKLLEVGVNIILESETCQMYFRKVEEFLEQKSIFNLRLKQQ
jgi:hypothetical protein